MLKLVPSKCLQWKTVSQYTSLHFPEAKYSFLLYTFVLHFAVLL